MITVVKSEKGQGILEFLIFLPFMIMMYSVTMSLSNSINASINQQKITRAYWHYRNLNNSTIPAPRREGGGEPSDSWSKFGMQIMGWAENFSDASEPVAPCYEFRLALGQADDDSCEESYTGSTSQFIRVQTVYGICGATYGKSDEGIIEYPTAAVEAGVSHSDHCKIIE